METTPPADSRAYKQQIAGLSTLLQLQKKIRHLEDADQFGFFTVNETLRLLQYDQAVFWRLQGRRIKVAAVSGVDRPNENSPYVLWLRELFKYLQAAYSTSAPAVGSGDLPKRLQDGWREWSAPHGLWCPFTGTGSGAAAGLWLVRDTVWQPAEQALLAHLTDAYQHAWLALQHRSPRARVDCQGRWFRGSLLRVLLLAAGLAALFLPVELSVLAPAQVIPRDPLVVSAPLQGVIKQFYVQPNQQVDPGQRLFRLDDTEARNRYEVARKSVAVARAEYRQATQKSLSGRDQTANLDVLRARVEAQQAEVEYAAEELARSEVAAERPGIVIFADVNDWLGKPVVTGEKVLLLADPAQRELEIRVPLDNAVNLEPGARVRLFLNVDPAREIRATLRRTSYEPRKGFEGGLSYVVTAAFTREEPGLRIGLTGTAKIFGARKPLYYYLFRRPWAAVRETLGI